MSPAARWRLAFLGLTAVVLGMEVWAAADGNNDTDPWTDMIVQYVPGEVTAAAIGALLLWLPVHFWLRYRSKTQSRQGDPDE